MEGKSLKWLSLIFLLAFSLTTVNIASAVSTVVFVDPPEKLVWWDPTSFTVGINVSDVSDLYGWQVNMSWDPSIVSATTITEGVFLKGPFPWDSRPYHDATEPYAEQENPPTSNSTQVAGWGYYPVFPPKTLVQCVNAIDTTYAQTSTPDAEEEWGDFGLTTGSMSCVAELYVRVMSSTTESNITEQEKLEIKVSNDGGTSWGPPHTVHVYVSQLNSSVDVTDDFSWVPSMLTDANFKVRMAYKQIGATPTPIRVNYVAVKAVDTLVVEDPFMAYDERFDTYASFRYSDIQGNFIVFDLSHDFPSGAQDPAQETSIIVQVDFNMKYWANASSSSDKYKIAYYVDPSPTETLLEDWKSTETTLGNYTWPNKSEPNGGGWDWTDVSNIRIVVETDKVDGDPYAVFREYEAWVTVTHIRPTTKLQRIETGWALFSVNTQGSYPGLDGSGELASVEFEVLAYGDTVVNITDTVLFDSSTPPGTIPFTPEDGYCRNLIPGDIQGNTGGSPPDGDVDRYDFFAFAGCYGSNAGDPNYNPLADLQGDTGGTPPDGDVDRYDFFKFAGNYGKSI